MQKRKNNSTHLLFVSLGLLMIGFFALVFSKGLSLSSSKISSPLVGRPAKEFDLRILQGSELLLGQKAQKISLTDLKGAPLIINFWASWCSTCAEEAQIFEAFWKEHSSEGVKMLGVAVHDKEEDVMPFVTASGKSYPIGLDEEGRAALNYGVTGVPETIFINAQGVIVHKEAGPVTRPLLEKFLAKIKESST